MVDSEIKTKCMEFLQNKMTAVIATVTTANTPAASTIYFIIDEQFNFYFMTKKFTKKVESLETNQEVAMVIGYDNDPVTVQVHGTAEQITDAEEYARRLKELEKKFFRNAYVAPLFQLSEQERDLLIYKITPVWLRWLDLRGDKENGEFIQII
jgi:general stress protein 26